MIIVGAATSCVKTFFSTQSLVLSWCYIPKYIIHTWHIANPMKKMAQYFQSAPVG